jgi:hypothetical protein
VNETPIQRQPTATDTDARQRRVELARQAFREFSAQCFWSYDPDLVVTEQHIPFIIRELRHNGGHKGYRVAAELCR